mmetsp:Transcript_717/g.1978  ORF Transcript_717/g.1978 Transcript_717/m.1978 type:complete len:222 (-) Transcript_717:350-1015(-)
MPSGPTICWPVLRSSAGPNPSIAAEAALQAVTEPRSRIAVHWAAWAGGCTALPPPVSLVAAGSLRRSSTGRPRKCGAREVPTGFTCRSEACLRPLTLKGTPPPSANAKRARRAGTSSSQWKALKKSRPRSPQHPGGMGMSTASARSSPHGKPPIEHWPSETICAPAGSCAPGAYCERRVSSKTGCAKRLCTACTFRTVGPPLSSMNLASAADWPTAISTAK